MHRSRPTVSRLIRSTTRRSIRRVATITATTGHRPMCRLITTTQPVRTGMIVSVLRCSEDVSERLSLRSYNLRDSRDSRDFVQGSEIQRMNSNRALPLSLIPQLTTVKCQTTTTRSPPRCHRAYQTSRALATSHRRCPTSIRATITTGSRRIRATIMMLIMRTGMTVSSRQVCGPGLYT